MSNVSVRMEGLDELRTKLAAFSRREDITKTALEKSGEHLRKAIADSTPVRTGALKEAIVKGEVTDGKILIGPSQQGPAFRAHFVEYGTSKMKAKPFLRPTFEQEKSTVERIMAEEIRKGLKL